MIDPRPLLGLLGLLLLLGLPLPCQPGSHAYYSVLRYEDSGSRARLWHRPTLDEARSPPPLVDNSTMPIPLLLHRSHRFRASQLERLGSGMAARAAGGEAGKAARVRRNLESCGRFALNGEEGAETRYYDDAGLVDTMEKRILPALDLVARQQQQQRQQRRQRQQHRSGHRNDREGAREEEKMDEAAEAEAAEAARTVRAAWRRLSEDPVLSRVFVLRADVFRLAVVWLEGGWWLDADVSQLVS